MSTSPTDSSDDPVRQREHLWSIIKDIRFAMFTTRDAHGDLQSRPMTTQNRSIDDDSSLWFFMSRSQEPANDISGDPRVNLAYADPGSDRYVSVTGHAALVDDAARRRALWSPMAEAWFPAGVDDPDLGLVRVQITQASYWDVKDSKLVQLFKMARAAVTGHPPTDMGEHAEISLR